MKHFTEQELLDILRCYKIMILRNGNDFPTVVLDDIEKSISSVLRTAGQDFNYHKIRLSD